MHPDDEKILRLSKEIIIKFIELGRVSPGNFDENFKSVFWTLKNTLVNARIEELKDEAWKEEKSNSLTESEAP